MSGAVSRLAVAVVLALAADGYMPEVIVAGITWADGNPNWDDLRVRDFCPITTRDGSRGGGASQFLEVLRQEVIPLVEGTYRCDAADRALVGSSFGGTFALHALFQAPELFRRYVTTSVPYFGEFPDLFAGYEEALAATGGLAAPWRRRRAAAVA